MAIAVVGVLAPLANVLTLTTRDSARPTANAFTSVNAGVFLALLLGVLGTTGDGRRDPRDGPSYRRALGAKARAYGIIGAGAVLMLGALAAIIALPIIHARGIPLPSSHTVVADLQRDHCRRAPRHHGGCSRRDRGGSVASPALIGVLAIEAVADAYIPFIKNYGPIGSLNAFSDPSHHHQLSVGAGGAVALGWAIVALLAATGISERRPTRSPPRRAKASSHTERQLNS